MLSMVTLDNEYPHSNVFIYLQHLVNHNFQLEYSVLQIARIFSEIDWSYMQNRCNFQLLSNNIYNWRHIPKGME